jgi:hypothetical protein
MFMMRNEGLFTSKHAKQLQYNTESSDEHRKWERDQTLLLLTLLCIDPGDWF